MYKWLALITLAGCPGIGDDAPATSKGLHVTVDEFAAVPVALQFPLNTPVTLTARLTTDDGSPATGYTFTWAGTWGTDPDVEVTSASGGDGVEIGTFVFHREAYFRLQATASVDYGAGADVAHTRFVPLVAWGGKTVELDPFETRAQILVGEHRPLAIWDGSEGKPDGIRSRGRTPIAYKVTNPAIATVDADGVVTGVQMGQTTLTATSGDASTTITLLVYAGSGVVPPDGSYPFAHVEGPAKLLGIHGPIENKVALDSHHYPSVLAGVGLPATASPTQGALELATWTGSGFGTRWVSEPWEVAQQASLIIDEHDAPFVVYRSGYLRDLVIADHGRFRRIDMSYQPVKDAGLYTDQYVRDRDPDDQPIAMARAGGGMWVAWREVLDFRDQAAEQHGVAPYTPPKTCADLIRLAEVTEASITVEDVSIDWYDGPEAAGDACRELRGGSYYWRNFLHLVDAPHPRIIDEDSIIEGDTLERNPSVILEPIGGAWQRRQLTHPTIVDNVVNPRGIYVVHGDPAILVTADAYDGAPSGASFNGPPGKTWPPIYPDLNNADCVRNPFGFQAHGQPFYGRGCTGPLATWDAYGATGDDPTAVWRPVGTNDIFPVGGAAARDRTLVYTSSVAGVASLLVATLPEATPLPSETEANGRVLGRGLGTASTPPFAFGGARMFLVDGNGAPLLSSASPDAPLVTAGTRAPFSLLAKLTRVFAAGTSLYGVELDGQQLVLARSDDGGATFATAAQQAVPTIGVTFFGAFVDSRGAAWALVSGPSSTNSFEVWYCAPGGTWQSRGGLTAAELGTFLAFAGGFVETPTGVLAVLVGNGAHLFVRELASDGTTIADHPLATTASFLSSLAASSLVRRSDGGLVILSQHSAVAIAPDLTTVTTSALPVPVAQALVPAPVAVGSALIWPTVEALDAQHWQAGTRVSTDGGVTWGPLRVLAPDAGWSQHAIGALAVAGGALVEYSASFSLAPPKADDATLLVRFVAP